MDNIYGVSEEYNPAGGPTTSPFLMAGTVSWGEVSIAFD